MANINLLPWREERRKELNQTFFITTGILAVLGLVAVFLVNMQVGSQIDNQIERNNYIIAEQQKLEDKILEIEELKSRRAQLESRMKIIQDLQGNRSVVVRLFDEIVKSTPDGVYLKKINRVGTKFTIEGIAEANSRISNLLRNLDRSNWFQNADLTSVVADDNKVTNIFELKVDEEHKKDKDKSKNDDV